MTINSTGLNPVAESVRTDRKIELRKNSNRWFWKPKHNGIGLNISEDDGTKERVGRQLFSFGLTFTGV